MTADELTALNEATQALAALADRLEAHHRGEVVLSDDELEALLRESGPAVEAWQESFRQGIITARAPEEEDKPDTRE